MVNGLIDRKVTRNREHQRSSLYRNQAMFLRANAGIKAGVRKFEWCSGPYESTLALQTAVCCAALGIRNVCLQG